MFDKKFKVGDSVFIARATTSYSKTVGEGKQGTVLENSTSRTTHVDWGFGFKSGHGRSNDICTGNCYNVENGCLELAGFTEENCPCKPEHFVMAKLGNCPFCGAKIKGESK